MSDFGLSSIVGAGMGLLLEGHNDRRQIEQQRRLQALQIQGQQEMGNYNYGKQLQFWKDTNFQAQMQQLKMAGLNPALLYKQGGAGGMTIGAPGGNITGASAPTGGMEIMNMIAQKANVDLIKAQTDKTKAETSAVAPGIEKTQAETASLTQGIQNQKAQEELLHIERSIKATEDFIKGKTQNAAIGMMLQELREGYARMEIMERLNTIDEATKDEKIELMEIQVVTALINNSLTTTQIGAVTAGTKKTMAEISKMNTDIAIAWRQIRNAETQTQIEQQLANWETSLGSQATGIIRTLLEQLPGKAGGPKSKGGKTKR